MTIFCEPKLDGPFNFHTNPPSDARYEICVKCGTTWVHGTTAPTCASNSLGAATAAFLPLESHETFTGEQIMKAAEVPHSALLDPVIRDLASDEPFFVLRASDLLADYLVEQWARNAESHGCDPKRVQGAREKARSMRAWTKRAYPA